MITGKSRGSTLAALALLAATGCVPPLATELPAHAPVGGALERLAARLDGVYDTHVDGRASNVEPEQRLRDRHARINAPALGDVVFYLQLNRGPALELYRQRVLIFDFDATRQQLIQRAYTLVEPARFEDRAVSDPVFASLTPDDIKPMFAQGCEQVWRETDAGFTGYVDPATCRIISQRTGKPRRIEATTVVTGDALGLAERGYDDHMTPLFGSPPGHLTTLHRLTAP